MTKSEIPNTKLWKFSEEYVINANSPSRKGYIFEILMRKQILRKYLKLGYHYQSTTNLPILSRGVWFSKMDQDFSKNSEKARKYYYKFLDDVKKKIKYKRACKWLSDCVFDLYIILDCKEIHIYEFKNGKYARMNAKQEYYATEIKKLGYDIKIFYVTSNVEFPKEIPIKIYERLSI